MTQPSPELIREVPGQRRVSRTFVAGQPCVTRVLLHTRISPGLGPLVEKIVLQGHGSMLGIIPEELQLTLEGYRVAARLPRDVGPQLPWTRAVAAGVDAEGHVTISTGWIEGTPLHHVPSPTPDLARVRALDALRILLLLHGRLVTYGDFKSENLVLRPDGTIALIDLDTLREVAEPAGWAPTRDLTRSWAAPEQENAHRTYLASDLWSWARLVEHLFPAGAPAAWRGALSACRREDPLARPRTDVLLGHLELGTELVDWRGRPVGETAGADLPEAGAGREPGSASLYAMGGVTDRVPEPAFAGAPAPAGATERVPENTSPKLVNGATERVPDITAGRVTAVEAREVTNTATRPRAKARGRGCLWWVLAAFVAPFSLCAGIAITVDRTRVAEANEAAADTLAALKAHKTRAELNRDRTQRDTLRGMADAAFATRATPRTAAVRALATVWSQGWQDSGREWSQARYDEGWATLEGGAAREPESMLARGTLEAAACRLDRTSVTAAAACTHALETLSALQARLPADAEHNWLRMEAAWTEVLVRSELVAQAATAGLLPERDTQLAAARDLCVRAEPWLPYAPVNGPELLQDCLRLSGAAADVPSWFRWADLLVGVDVADGALSETTVRHLYGSGGAGCDDTSVSKRKGAWQVKGSHWCVALGHAARGCRESAASSAIEGRVYEPARPWDSFDTALAGRPASSCVP